MTTLPKLARNVCAKQVTFIVLTATLALTAPSLSAQAPKPPSVPVTDNIVVPRQPVAKAIDEAMRFLKKADGAYVPGNIQGELAGYFTSAFVNEDGSRSDRQVAFPARQHAYFIFTFLRYHSYTGEREWLLRARDLADWNLAHSTPSNAFYPNIPYSVYSNGKPGGSADKDTLEPDKVAFLGTAYIALYEATQENKYLAGAKAVAQTLCRRQNQDGSWPFRVVPEDGTVRQDFGGAPVFFVDFFEKILRHDKEAAYQTARDKAFKLMADRNVKKGHWGTYHEDIRNKTEDKLSAEPMCFTAAYLFRNAKAHPEYIEMGRKVLQQVEQRLVHTNGHPVAPAPAVSEQDGFEHMMPGHTARYCMALTELFAATGDQAIKRKAISGFNGVTYMQSAEGLFRTFFQLRNERTPGKKRPNWYSQHLYTVCHALESMPSLPELQAPKKPTRKAPPVGRK